MHSRGSVRYYSAEEKPAEEPEKNKQLPSTVDDCHKQIESLTTELNTFKEQSKDFEVSLR